MSGRRGPAWLKQGQFRPCGSQIVANLPGECVGERGWIAFLSPPDFLRCIAWKTRVSECTLTAPGSSKPSVGDAEGGSNVLLFLFRVYVLLLWGPNPA